MSIRLIPLSVCIALVACGAADQPPEPAAAGTAAAAGNPQPEALRSGVEPAFIDDSVRPQDDFYTWVNGGWMAESEIPADRSRWGAFDELQREAQDNLRAIVEEVAAVRDAEPGSPEQMIGDLYRSFMHEEQLESLGIAPLEPLLERIAGADDRDRLRDTMAVLQRRGVSGPFVYYVRQDAGDSSRYVSYFNQAGLGLPDRDYYTDEGEQADALREAYLNYMRRMLTLAGDDDPDATAEAVMGVETRLAGHQWTRTRNRNPVDTYNPMSTGELSELAPGFDWRAFIAASGMPEPIDEVVVRQPDYLTAAVEVLADTDLADLRRYLHWQTLNEFGSLMSRDFADARFDFYGRVLQGMEEQRPRWERALSAINSLVGFQLGRLYVDRHFDDESSVRMQVMVDTLFEAFGDTLSESPWMSGDTREEAMAKLAGFNAKIGYPVEWETYDGLEIRADDLLGNYLRSSEYEYERMLARLHEPVDRDEWFITPQTVNAYYSPGMNEIVFPAAILQPPFFDVDADDAVNYGAIGAVIGHEISHGFDDSGRRMDADGNLRDWWSEGSAEEFDRRAEVLAAQYGALEPLPGVNLNPQLTMGENIADHGGLRVAWRAYQRSLNGGEAPELDGYTGAQRFFMGWARVWRQLQREEAMRRQLQTGAHPPGRYRVNAVLRNIPAFYDTFDLQPGDELYLPQGERADIW